MRSVYVDILAFTVLASCAPHLAEPDHPTTPPASTQSIWWAPVLELTSLSAIPQRLDRPFPDAFDVVAQVDGQLRNDVASNCSTALALMDEGYQPMSSVDGAAFKQAVAQCQVIKALAAARPATEGVAAFGLDEDALSALPPTLGPEPNPTDIQQREAATRAGQSWRAHDPEARVEASNAWQAKATGGDWTTELELLARADFDADGREDILILTLSYGTEGNWTEVRLHQLTSKNGQKILQVVRRLPI
jgi:hypothetical protein